MEQKEIDGICQKLGIASLPIADLQLPSEEELEKKFETTGCYAYDDEFEQAVAYNNFKNGYVLAMIEKRTK